MGGYKPNMGVDPNLGGESELRARIAEAIAVGGGVSAVVSKTGIPLGTISKYAAKTSTPSFSNAAKIAYAAGVGLDMIAFGGRPLAAAQLHAMTDRLASRPNDGFLSTIQPSTSTGPDQLGMIRLPVYGDVRAAAGRSAIPASEMSDGVISFDPRFLRDQGAVPERCTVIWAHGDSMVPTIPDGSALIVDHSQTEVKNGSIMVIGVGDDLLVKRVRRRLDGLIDLISDNTAYASETLGPDSLRQLRVIGRVVYFCRTP